MTSSQVCALAKAQAIQLKSKQFEIHMLCRAIASREDDKLSRKRIQEAREIRGNTSCENLPYDIATSLKWIGLNRFSLANPALFEAHNRHCKQLYGFPSYPYMKEEPDNVPVCTGNNTDKGLCDFEQVLLTFFFMNSHYNYDIIGWVFGIESRATVRKYLSKWLVILGKIRDFLHRFIPLLDKEAYNF